MDTGSTSEVEEVEVEVVGPVEKGRLVEHLPIAGQKRSEWWDHFLQYSIKRTVANCKHCKKDISLGASLSSFKLKKHMSTHLKTRIDSEKQKLVQPSTKSNFSSSSSISNSSSSSSNNSSSSSSSSSSSYSSSSSNIKSGNLNHHVVHCPDFPNAYVKWMVRTLQPLNTCESEEFREMTHAINIKAPNLTAEGVKSKVVVEVADVK